MKVRKPWIAFSLSMLCPGLGQFYNGNLLAAAIAFVLGLGLSLVGVIYFFGTLRALAQAILISLVFDLVFAVHAFWDAKKIGAMALRPFQRWWFYLGFVAVVYGLPDGYGTFMPSRFLSFQIPSESMLPNLLVGDRLVADGWAYWGAEPKRGEVIVFKYPKDPSINYVKRVVGVPGDVVEIRGGELFVNEKQVFQQRTSSPAMVVKGWGQEEFLERQDEKEYRIYRAQPYTVMNFGPVTVPEKKFFVMGDNRDRSNDSRMWGFVPREAVVGRMTFIYFSWNSESGSLRQERIGQQIH